MLSWAPRPPTATCGPWSCRLTTRRSSSAASSPPSAVSPRTAWARWTRLSGAGLPWAANQTIQDADRRCDHLPAHRRAPDLRLGLRVRCRLPPSRARSPQPEHRQRSTCSTTAMGTPTARCPSARCSTPSATPTTAPTSAPSSRPTRGRSTCGTRWPSRPTRPGQNVGPDDYGWNYDGMPASALLQWFPISTRQLHRSEPGRLVCDGQRQLRRARGRVPRVNGRPQQGLVRFAVAQPAPNKRGPGRLRRRAGALGDRCWRAARCASAGRPPTTWTTRL